MWWLTTLGADKALDQLIGSEGASMVTGEVLYNATSHHCAELKNAHKGRDD